MHKFSVYLPEYNLASSNRSEKEKEKEKKRIITDLQEAVYCNLHSTDQGFARNNYYHVV